MSNIFDHPDVKAATAAAEGIHEPGAARELTPTAAPPAGSPFIRRGSAVQPVAGGVRDIRSAPSHPTAAASPVPARAPGQPRGRGKAQSDRSLKRGFDRWLRRQPGIAAPSPGEESGMFGELLAIARDRGMDLRSPDGVLELADLFAEVDDPEQEAAAAAVIATLHDYVHFQIDTAADPDEWDDIHDAVEELMEEPLPGADILYAAMSEADELDPDERRAALAATRLVDAVPELLCWIGSGRKVAPSGGLRRVDIARGAALLGIAAAGVDRLPPFAADSPPLIPVEAADHQPAALRVRSMQDLPLLPAWWGALASAGVIEVGRYRVTPGPTAPDWTTGSPPPLDQAEMIVGLTVGQYVCEDIGNRSAFFAEPAAAIMISRLLQALAPDKVEPAPEEDGWAGLLDQRVRHDLQRLEQVGVLTSNSRGDLVVPAGLRGAVARGVITAFALLGGDPETD